MALGWNPYVLKANAGDASMPIYEYQCVSCHGHTAIFLRTMSAESSEVTCEHCGSGQLHRMVSGFSIAKSTQSVWDQSGPASANPSDEYYRDPRNIGRWTEERLSQLGVDMPTEARDMIDAARDGTMPSPIDEL